MLVPSAEPTFPGLVFAIASAGVVAGTLLGERVLLGLSPARFREIIGVLIGLPGAWLIFRAG